MDYNPRRLSYIFLCTVPLLAIGVGSVRELRMNGLYQTIGGALFTAIVIGAWILGGRAIGGAEREQRIAIAGGFLIVPFALVSLLWVGLGPPWIATPPENVMRYLVLLASSIAIAGGFLVLKDVLSEAGEHCYSTLGFVSTILAGPVHVIWTSFAIGIYVTKGRDGHVPPAVESLGDEFEILLLVACALTYLATAAFAASFGRTRWFGRGATRAYIAVNIIAFLCLGLRGMSFPDPTNLSTPWYTQPGFVAGIPAIPFIMPFLLGVVLLRRAGDQQR